MRRLKIFDLLKKRESVSRQKTISQLKGVSADAEKCRNISTELDKLLKEKQSDSGELKANSFIIDRHLQRKMMDQKEILGNRLEYLENQRSSALADLDKSEAKLKVFANESKDWTKVSRSLSDHSFKGSQINNVLVWISSGSCSKENL